MWSTEHSENTPADAPTVWRLWSDVGGWSSWDSSVESAELDGAFAAGSRGRLAPHGARAVRFSIVEAVARERFVTECRPPLARLRFEHWLTSGPDGGTTITHRTTIIGPLSPLFARLIGRQIAADLPDAVPALARLAASQAQGSVADDPQPSAPPARAS